MSVMQRNNKRNQGWNLILVSNVDKMRALALTCSEQPPACCYEPSKFALNARFEVFSSEPSETDQAFRIPALVSVPLHHIKLLLFRLWYPSFGVFLPFSFAEPFRLSACVGDGGHCARWDLQVQKPVPRSVLQYNPLLEVYRQLLWLHGLVCGLTCTVRQRQVRAFPHHVQSTDVSAGGLRSNRRNMWQVISGNRMQLLMYMLDFVFPFLIKYIKIKNFQQTCFTLSLWDIVCRFFWWKWF